MKTRSRIYLDACCLNRPFDDQVQDRIRRESDAVKEILLRIGTGEWSWTGSEVLLFEIGRMPDPDRKLGVGLMTGDVTEHVVPGEAESARAGELRKLGFKDVDALHLACAEKARVDVFLTTDDAILKVVARNPGALTIKIRNPLKWLSEVLDK